jgi:hypothetical protein
MQLYIYLDNPDTQSGQSDLRSSCFGPRVSVLVFRSLVLCFSQGLPYIYEEGSVSRYGWGIELLPYMGFILKMDHYQKFYNLSTNIFMGFYFWK